MRNDKEIPGSAYVFAGTLATTGNPLLAALAVAGIEAANFGFNYVKKKKKDRQQTEERQRQARSYRRDSDAKQRHEREIQRLRSLPPSQPMTLEERFDELRERSLRRKWVISQLPLSDDEQRQLHQLEDEKFLDEVQELLQSGAF